MCAHSWLFISWYSRKDGKCLLICFWQWFAKYRSNLCHNFILISLEKIENLLAPWKMEASGYLRDQFLEDTEYFTEKIPDSHSTSVWKHITSSRWSEHLIFRWSFRLEFTHMTQSHSDGRRPMRNDYLVRTLAAPRDHPNCAGRRFVSGRRSFIRCDIL
jgi:hypothetical protein